MNEERKSARWRTRRIIYNNDGDDVIESKTRHDTEEALMVNSGAGLIDDFLNARSMPLVGSQVDSNWYCSCMAGLMFSHRTMSGNFYGKGIPKDLVEKYGRDSLEIQADFSHQNGMEVFWSLRMNDGHDAYPMGSRRWTYGLASFKQDHPEYLMGQPQDWDKYPDGPRHAWSHLDFSFADVRENILSLIQEVCEGYDVEGVELDFLRSYPYFRETLDWNPVDGQHLDMMTDLVRRVRDIADKAGQQRRRPILLAVRTPFKVEDSRFIGLDLKKWLEEELIDILIPGGAAESKMTESFVDIVNLGHEHDVPVYPCIGWGFWNYWAFLDLGAKEHRTPGDWVKALRGEDTSFAVAINLWKRTMEAWRGAAMNLFKAGADGIYTFNAFFANPDIFQEIGDPGTMANKDKIFGVDQFSNNPSFKSVNELELKRGNIEEMQFQVGEDLTLGNNPEVKFRLHFWGLTNYDEIDVKLNNQPVDGLKLVEGTGSSLDGRWIGCRLNPLQVKNGENEVGLVVRGKDYSGDSSLLLDAVQLSVSYKS